MKIMNIKVEKSRIKLAKPFKISAGISYYSETIIVKIETDEGIVGIGGGSPSPRVTGENLDTAVIVCELIGKSIIGLNPLDIEKIHFVMDKCISSNTAAKACIDIALYDILGKSSNLPLYKLLGGYDNSLETDITISIDEPQIMVKDAVVLKEKGINILKVKVGGNIKEDIRRVEAIRKAVGDNMIIRLDANQGWNVNEAINGINALEAYNIESIEQPVVYWDIDGLARIREHTNIPIMADESIHSPQDAIRLIKKEAVDIINIKLMKCGGIYNASRINAIAEAAGIECMLGCMVETTISITAAASFAAAHKNVTKADLDSISYFDAPQIKGGVVMDKGILTLPDKPGLGVEY